MADTGRARAPAVDRQAEPAAPADTGTGWVAAAVVAAAAAAATAAAAAPAGRDSGRRSPCRLGYRLKETDRWQLNFSAYIPLPR